MIAETLLFVALANAVPASGDHFIVACALFGPKKEGSQTQSFNLNLLVNAQPDAIGNLRVESTFDPDKVLPSAAFKTAFFDRAGKVTKFIALTGKASEAGTWAIVLQARAPAEYDAMLSDAKLSGDIFKGRCWMSNNSNATEEFEKLKAFSR